MFGRFSMKQTNIFVRTEGPNKFEKLMEAEELVRKSDWAASTSVQRPLSDWQQDMRTRKVAS